MQCPQCHQENDADAKFCEACGAKLARLCPSCGHELKPQAKFCGQCGARLADAVAAKGSPRHLGEGQGEGSNAAAVRRSPHPSPLPEGEGEGRSLPEGEGERGFLAAGEGVQSPGGERRQLTVLFCDLVGSTEIAARLDPEEWSDIAAEYQRTAAAAVTRFGGHVAKYLGDGLVVYFGYPQAHDDDPERAVRAGLAIVEAVKGLGVTALGDQSLPLKANPLTPNTLYVRVGMHTGLVVLTPGGGTEVEVFGDVPHVAARVQAVATPDTVVITGIMHRLVAGIFVVEELGAHTLKGVPEPVQLYRVVQPSGVQSRLAAAGQRLTPLVGRESEVAALLDRWEQVAERDGQAVVISGEAGVGKSRLVCALRERLADQPHTWLECRSAPYTEHSAFRPLVELVEQGLTLSDADTPAQKVAKLESGLERAGFPLAETVPLFAAFLGLPLTDAYVPLRMSPELQRKKTIQALVAWTVALGELQPVLLLVEDLHWCDPSSLEVLGHLIEQSQQARVLLVCTARPEFSVPWPARSHLTLTQLHRLTKRQAREAVAALVAKERQAGTPAPLTESISAQASSLVAQASVPASVLPEPVIEQIIARADGIPLYLEELTHAVLESGLLQERDGRYELTGSLEALAIPMTLQDSLTARLDRLSAAKEVAQRAAVLGREFSYVLLAAAAGLDEAMLRQGLARLVEAELVFQRGEPPEATYTIKHALIQEAAYQSLLKRTRQQLHARVAQVLEAQFPERAAAEPGVVARHYEAAGMLEPAVTHYQRAGEQAAARSAHEEAIAHLRTAIAVLERLAENRERDGREASLQRALGSSLIAVRGWAHPETEAAWARARVLSSAAGDHQGYAAALLGHATVYFNAAQFERALDMIEEALKVAQTAHDDVHVAGAYAQKVAISFYQGRFKSAVEHSQSAIRLYDPARHHQASVSLFGVDTGVAARSCAPCALWQLGYPDRALAGIREAVEVAVALDHPFSIAHIRFFEVIVHWLRGEVAAQRQAAEEVMRFAEAQGFPLWLGVAKMFRGHALGDPGEVTDGMTRAAETGNQAGAPVILQLLAEAQRACGQYDAALGTIETGLAVSAATGQPLHDADLHRLKGEIILVDSRQSGVESEKAAEECFHRALDIARAQEAKSFELRAATSLARLLRGQGKPDEARALLASIHNWFTEGFETRDLIEAKALLEELGKVG